MLPVMIRWSWRSPGGSQCVFCSDFLAVILVLVLSDAGAVPSRIQQSFHLQKLTMDVPYLLVMSQAGLEWIFGHFSLKLFSGSLLVKISPFLAPKVLQYWSVLQSQWSVMVMGCMYCVAVCVLEFSWPLVEFSASPRAEKWSKVSFSEVLRWL